MKKREEITSEYEMLLDENRPQLDDAWFEEADAYVGTKLVRRGRPKSDNPKQAVSLRIDSDILEYFRGTGNGWQSRMNAELRKAAGL